MRLAPGAALLVFNAHDGEWRARGAPGPEPVDAGALGDPDRPRGRLLAGRAPADPRPAVRAAGVARPAHPARRQRRDLRHGAVAGDARRLAGGLSFALGGPN